MTGPSYLIAKNGTTVDIRIGDVFDRLAEIPDGTIDLVLTSPPFLALRSYLPADHPDKAKEIGSEANPAEFIDTLLRLSAEWRRVLAPHGSICVELGDTYAGSWVGDSTPLADNLNAQGGSRLQDRRRNSHQSRNKLRESNLRGWPLDKSMCGIPHLYHLSLAYGRNLLTGQPSPAGQWRVRNVVAWCRPNPPVGALGDKVRPATSYMTMACISRTRYFDLDAVRSGEQTKAGGTTTIGDRGSPDEAKRNRITNTGSHPAGAPPLDWWEIPTEPYSGAHYACWPKALLTRPILMMCPEKVCRVCGEPSRRIVESVGVGMSGRGLQTAKLLGGGRADQSAGWERVAVTTLGWTDCGCSTDGSHWRRGVVLDPFGGSGTTAVVASRHGRDCIMIDLDPRNLELMRERLDDDALLVERETAQGLPSLFDWSES